MAEVVVFHHIHGLTGGVLAFADRLRAAGHGVHVPDLYDGAVFETFADGTAHAEAVGFDAIAARGVAAVTDLPDALVYLGFSLGVLPAQELAQQRPGARGALLLHSCVPVSAFGDAWPAGVPVQVHGSADDPLFRDDGDLEAARELVAGAPDEAELFVYPGSRHLFADEALPDFEPAAATLLEARVLEFLAR